MKGYLGENTPKLGFGLMRLPQVEGEPGKTDVEKTKEMVDLFMEAGFTYFDTAFVYGDSEIATRQALVERYPRESYTLATKMNAWLGSPSLEDTKAQFEKSLANTGAGYFDYYLLHAVQENNHQIYDEYGLWDFVRGLKKKGKIRHWGFSYHAGPELLDELLTRHPDAEFIQLQVNYADMEAPNVRARENIEVAVRHGVPYTIMEPAKGGLLANPPASVKEIFEAANPELSSASWAIRFAASQDGVITVLSGMSTVEQMKDNISYMKDFQPMTAAELETVKKAQEALDKIDSIRCTSCHYCVGGCPMNIKIPEIFVQMNRYKIYNDMENAKRYFKFYNLNASSCIQCGQCEGACPQSLPIMEYLQEAAEKLED